MVERKNLIKELKLFLQKLSTKLNVTKFILFGSRANGRPRKLSDVDLVVVSPDFRGKQFFERPVGFHQFWKIDLPAEFLCFTPEEFEKSSRNQFSIASTALKQGIQITL